MDPRQNYNTLAENSIKWVMENPFPSLKTPYWEPENVSISHPDTRPRGSIQVFRIYQKIDNKESFKSIA